MSALISLREALNDPALLGRSIPGESFAPWRGLLCATMGEPLLLDELPLFREVTGREAGPTERVEEALFLIGRRGGKDRAVSVLATYLAALVDYSGILSAGERGLVVVMGPDQRQAKIQLDYIEGVFTTSPTLSKMVVSRTQDTLELSNGLAIEVRAASFRRLRGPTAVAVIATEASFWYSDETSANADAEILGAARPMLATTGGPLIIITSPHGKKGEVFSLFRRHYGPEGDPRILVVKAPTRTFNPTLRQSVVDRALERDYAAASAEYLAEFRNDIESFVAIEVVETCIEPGVHERAPLSGVRYYGFVDPSGGSVDSMTLAIGHREGERIVIDATREVRPPFSPEGVVSDFATVLKSYRIAKVHGDRYAGEWPREQFRKYGVDYVPSEKVRSDLFRDLLPRLNAASIVLLDDRRLAHQLANLERKVSRAGKDSITHGPGGHDDLANVVAGVASLAHKTEPLIVSEAVLARASRPPSPRSMQSFLGGNR